MEMTKKCEEKRAEDIRDIQRKLRQKEKKVRLKLKEAEE